MDWHDTGMSSNTGEGQSSRRIEIGTLAVLMVNVGERWLAIEDRCSHAGCAFSDDGEVDGTVIVCNCHGSEFDLRTGAVLAPPATAPIATYPVRVRHNRLEVGL
jgi:nitrite reductase/ring-hydroxylating ferredoxin subunit